MRGSRAVGAAILLVCGQVAGDGAADAIDAGDRAYLRKDCRTAVADYDAAVERDPSSARAYLGRARAKIPIGEDALDCLDAACRLDPLNPLIYYFRGEHWAARGEDGRAQHDLDTAIRACTTTISGHGADGPALWNRAVFHLALARLLLQRGKDAQGHWSQALADLAAALDTALPCGPDDVGPPSYPTLAASNDDVAASLGGLAPRFQAPKETLESLLERLQEQASPETVERLILAGQTQQAETMLARLEKASTPGTPLLRLQVCLVKKDQAGVEQAVARVRAEDARQAESAYGFACQMVDARQFDRALLWCDTVGALDPGAVSMRFTRGQALAGLGRKEEAKTEYEAYLQTNPPEDWAARAREAIALLSQPSPSDSGRADATLRYQGSRDGVTATIEVKKCDGQAWQSEVFAARAGDLIGGKVNRVVLGKQTELDFSTGYTLVEVLPDRIRCRDAAGKEAIFERR